ncbi:MAG TPA: hypothetical protein VF723_16330 [Pyrinomonadaceae bacterium]|jgi:hypothetical protein
MSSSSPQDQARLVAERIARRLSQTGGDEEASARPAGDVAGELAAMRASLDELKKRIIHVESHVGHEEDRNISSSRGESAGRASKQGPQSQARETATMHGYSQAPRLSGIYVPAAHPSQDKFGVDEAAISELVDFFEGEKKCELEPGGKPCDHCAMCSTRGF